MPLGNVNRKPRRTSNVARAAAIFEKHGDFIRSVISFFSTDQEEADEIFQELFLFLISKPIPREVDNVGAFLYKITLDTVKNASRRIERYQTAVQTYARAFQDRLAEAPDSVLTAKEERQKLFDLIRRSLPPKEATAVMLRYRYGCDTAEIADKMKIKRRSASRYVCIGLRMVRQLFAEEPALIDMHQLVCGASGRPTA